MIEPNIQKLTLLDLNAIEPEISQSIQQIAAKIVAAKVLKERLTNDVFAPLGELADH